jgi:hypothetical protein
MQREEGEEEEKEEEEDEKGEKGSYLDPEEEGGRGAPRSRSLHHLPRRSRRCRPRLQWSAGESQRKRRCMGGRSGARGGGGREHGAVRAHYELADAVLPSRQRRGEQAATWRRERAATGRRKPVRARGDRKARMRERERGGGGGSDWSEGCGASDGSGQPSYSIIVAVDQLISCCFKCLGHVYCGRCVV